MKQEYEVILTINTRIGGIPMTQTLAIGVEAEHPSEAKLKAYRELQRAKIDFVEKIKKDA